MQHQQRWPLRTDYSIATVSVTEAFDEVLSIFIPISALRPGAETFCDWPAASGSHVHGLRPNLGNAWFMFTLVFFKTAEMVVHRGKGSGRLVWEVVMSDSQDVLGYTFWLLYNNPKNQDEDEGGEQEAGMTLDQTVHRKILYYYRFLAGNIARGTSSDIVAARNEKKSIDQGRISRFEAWKGIKSDREWASMAALCTGMRCESDFEAASAVSKGPFKPEVAMGLRPVNTQLKQSCAAWIGMTGVLAGYVVQLPNQTKRIRWPEYARVYNMHPDSVYAINIMQSMLPHRQVQHMRTENILHILLPELARMRQGDESTPEREAEDLYRSIAMMHGMEVNEDNITAGSDIRSCTALLDVKGATGTAADIARSKRAATPYHGIAAATDAVLNEISEITDDPVSVKARKVAIIVREAAMASYESTCRHSPKMSPSMELLLDQIDQHQLFDLKKTRPFFKRPPPQARAAQLSFYGSYTRKCYTLLEHVFHINYLHRYCIIAEVCSLDAYRYKKGLHLNFCATSKNGGVGKSNIWGYLNAVRADGTVVILMYTTPAAATGGEGDNINMSDRIAVYDEMPPSMFNGDTTLTDAQARLKMILSEGYATVEAVVIDEAGKRQKVNAYIEHIGAVFMSSNLQEASDSMRRRFLMAKISENPSVQRPLIDTMNQEALDCSRMDDVKMAYRVVHWQKQALYATVEKLIHAGALPDVSTHICGVLNLAFMQELRRQQPNAPEPNASVSTRINLLARNLCIGRVLIDALLSPNEGDLGKRARPLPDSITPRDLSVLERRLFVTIEDFVGAVGMMVDEVVNPLEHAVSLALRMIYEERRKSESVQMFAEGFASELHQESDAQGKMQLSPSIDWNYLRWDMSRLVTRIAVLIPELMHGMETNRGAIETCLKSFCERSIKSRGFTEPDRSSVAPFDPHTDTSAPEKTWPAAMMPRRRSNESAAGDVYIHLGFLPSADKLDQINSGEWEGASTEARLVGEVLKKVLSTSNIIPRTMAFTSRCDSPKDLVYLKTQPEVGASYKTTVNLVTVASEADVEIAPELAELTQIGETQFDIGIDLDTYAIHMHNEALHISGEPVDPSFREAIQPPSVSEQPPPENPSSALSSAGLRGTNDFPGLGIDDDVLMQGEEEEEEQETSAPAPSGRYFAGIPVEEISPDSYTKWLKSRRRRIEEALEAPGRYDDDVDFDFAEFTALTPQGETREFWMEVDDFFPDPGVFGFDEWATEPEDRVFQFKLICYHPLVVDKFHLYLLGV